jgi:hypothetical protein
MRKLLIAGSIGASLAALVWILARQSDAAMTAPPLSAPPSMAARTPAPDLSVATSASDGQPVKMESGEAPPAKGPPLTLPQAYAAEPRDSSAQPRYQRVLEGVFTRTNYGAGFANSNFQCRGQYCRAELVFESADEQREVMSNMIRDAAWSEARGAFYATYDEGMTDDENARLIAYFQFGAQEPANSLSTEQDDVRR